MDLLAYNRKAWDAEVERGNQWTVPVSPELIARARRGDWSVVLTPVKPVPKSWFLPMDGLRVLGLASAGGQQGPVLAAAGAQVTVFDNSPGQLGRDREVAEREGLELELVEGDMTDLSQFADQSFDLIFHPCSNCFVADVLPVWREAFRVLRPGGVLLSGVCNPVSYIFDHQANERGELVVRHSIPYSDLSSISAEERQVFTEADEPLAFGHSLQDLLGGQLAAGFVIDGFFEDSWPEGSTDPLAKYIPQFIATRARRPL